MTKAQARALKLPVYEGSPCKRCGNTRRCSSNGNCSVCEKLRKTPKQPSDLEAELSKQFSAAGIRQPLTEYRFHETRKWRFDFAWPELKLAVEVEGGGWSGGRHTRGTGFEADLEKYDAAMRMGWNIYRCAGRLIKDGSALKTITVLINSAPQKEPI
jgi:very-short-patch-repair endonuclease